MFAILTQPFRSFHKKKKRKKGKNRKAIETPLFASSPDRVTHSVVFSFHSINLFAKVVASPTLGFTHAGIAWVRMHVILQHSSRYRSRGSVESDHSARARGMGRRAVLEREYSELEKRPYAFLANPTTEIIILADILANVRMQFYLLLSWETR